MTDSRVYGIDLGTTYTCIAHVDDLSGRPHITPNDAGELTTPSVVLFEDAETRVVGREAKNIAVMEAENVVEMIKREMGKPEWRREFFGHRYSPEEISSYILRKVVDDTERHEGTRPHKVVVTCPAYFGIPQREATAAAGRIAGLDVLEVINEPTAAAIAYGAQHPEDQVVLVYDLGGGTFDVTVIDIKDSAITVVATDGAHELGGRNWDEELVKFAAGQWQAEHPGAGTDPLDSPETVQDLWLRAERAKWSLSSMAQTKVAVTHDGQQVTVPLTREKFNDLTQYLLDSTMSLTRQVMETARELGYPKIDLILLVGGSTKMPQVTARLEAEFSLEVKSFEPDQAVAKGAAIYGQKLAVGERVRTEIGKKLDRAPEQVDVAAAPEKVRMAAEELVASDMGLRLGTVQYLSGMVVRNVVSHSFGVIALTADDTEVISNLVLAQQALPAEATRTFGIRHSGMGAVELRIFENTSREAVVKDLDTGEQVGVAMLELASDLPADSPVDVVFRLDNEGRLTVTGRDRSVGGKEVTAVIETNRALSAEQVAVAIKHANSIRILG
ncbi:Hsp70 family protein [Micromonospora carbonacea]|uniref:Hsp70 family protein n=1 Tax=Micromonospora carbonacea TaxID=47853 RepID=A0A7H8XUT2_9ACTN|nr:Hsp70 family protein [Micromonospora carbonacea]MBB5830031.1 molecular chaperone DnaK (HSP70) [Micromonospora carbonacea]QLD28029.1 Hsp70 family protein [Micromonospora carbonacea]